MKIVIWGTGKYYKKYIGYIPEEMIECVVDFDEKKHGSFIDGRLIQAPESIDMRACDYILILVKAKEDICKYLILKGIDPNKIIDRRHISRLCEKEPEIHVSGGIVCLRDWFRTNNVSRILLLSHSMGRTGAPLVLLRLGVLLSEKYKILFAGEGTGKLEEDLMEANLDYITDIEIFGDVIEEVIAPNFRMVFVNTITMYYWVAKISQKSIPIFWWIHETESRFYEGTCFSEINYECVHCFAVSVKAKEKIKEVSSGVNVEIMPYCLPDFYKHSKRVRDDEKVIRFAMIGTIDLRKAQDVLVDALLQIEDSIRTQMEIVIAGTMIPEEEKVWKDNFAKVPQIKYVGELSQEEVQKLYGKTDVFLCPSRDDPMPVVVTQAMMNRIPCIVSKKVGQADYIVHGKNGFVFPNENSKELAEIMIWCTKNKKCLIKIGKASREIYDIYFSSDKIKSLLDELITVSVGGVSTDEI